MYKRIADTIVDIVSEKNISPRTGRTVGFKRGFFLEKPYLPSWTNLKRHRFLVDKSFLDKEIGSGKRVIRVPRNSLITPMARLFIDENGIRIEKC